jgi:predicted PurR-regulated permease PerM
VIVAWPLAVLLKWLLVSGGLGTVQEAATQALGTLPAASQAAASQPLLAEQIKAFLWIALWPTVAYLVAQFLDSWLITPIIQARSSNLTAVTIIIVVLVGGAMGGLYGLLLAIPVAACVKILGKEVLIPHLHQWAQEE